MHLSLDFEQSGTRGEIMLTLVAAEMRDFCLIDRLEAESFFAATGADIRHGGDSAFYVPSQDFIQMPAFEAFRDAQSYYATLAHESCHWTRHEGRLDRDLGRKRFGDEGYAREELVAELGAAFLCADLGLHLEDRDDHAAYIGSWLKVLKDDRRAILACRDRPVRHCRSSF